ncbi:hypothetical protein NDU88_004017 [Pleurodeles waltl]|uniref:Uncharacterized protein n=1 Tax=Pleurodeles waltl TaxID=8319 RepID=A0AAV7TQP8_PLEWA|nr:hypothetical protein NDU88_004017 [Pleurodeles waltl]
MGPVRRVAAGGGGLQAISPSSTRVAGIPVSALSRSLAKVPEKQTNRTLGDHTVLSPQQKKEPRGSTAGEDQHGSYEAGAYVQLVTARDGGSTNQTPTLVVSYHQRNASAVTRRVTGGTVATLPNQASKRGRRDPGYEFLIRSS